MRAVGPACLVLLAGCGPIEYIANVPFRAAGAVAEAKHLDGLKYAPYEMTAAREYLHKARELGGYARFHSSVGFAEKATKLAGEAKKICQDRAREVEDKPEAPPEGGLPATKPMPAAPSDRPVPTVHIESTGEKTEQKPEQKPAEPPK
jgi:hypothetical protein